MSSELESLENQKKPLGLAGWAIFFALAVVIVGTGIVQFQNFQRESEKLKIRKLTAEITKQIQEFSGKDDSGAYFRAAELLPNAKEIRKKWSRIASDTLSFESDEVEFQSLSISEEKVSIDASARTHGAVSRLIESIKKSKIAKSPFVPSISLEKSSSDRDKFPVNFQISFELKK